VNIFFSSTFSREEKITGRAKIEKRIASKSKRKKILATVTKEKERIARFVTNRRIKQMSCLCNLIHSFHFNGSSNFFIVTHSALRVLFRGGKKD
jgi:hypothetical protein